MRRLICACFRVGRKYELYSMDWDLKEELRDCLVAAAPYGGPIGMSPLCRCMLWDNRVDSRSTSLEDPCRQVVLADVCRSDTPHLSPAAEVLYILVLLKPASSGVGLGSCTENLSLNCSPVEEPVAEGEGCRHTASARDLLCFRPASGQSAGEHA